MNDLAACEVDAGGATFKAITWTDDPAAPGIHLGTVLSADWTFARGVATGYANDWQPCYAPDRGKYGADEICHQVGTGRTLAVPDDDGLSVKSIAEWSVPGNPLVWRSAPVTARPAKWTVMTADQVISSVIAFFRVETPAELELQTRGVRIATPYYEPGASFDVKLSSTRKAVGLQGAGRVVLATRKRSILATKMFLQPTEAGAAFRSHLRKRKKGIAVSILFTITSGNGTPQTVTVDRRLVWAKNDRKY